jgi:hypothetical protein
MDTNTNIPAELLDLKTRFDEWNKSRKCIRSRIPDDLRLATIEMLRRYPSALLSDLCRISRSTLNRLRQDPKKSRKKSKPKEPFFILPSPSLPEPAPATGGCRIQLERPDGSRLTLILPLLDSSTITSLCDRFFIPENR